MSEAVITTDLDKSVGAATDLLDDFLVGDAVPPAEVIEADDIDYPDLAFAATADEAVAEIGRDDLSDDALPEIGGDDDLNDLIETDVGYGGDGYTTPGYDLVDENPYFTCLGYYDGNFYFQSRKKGSILSFPTGKLNSGNLLALAPLSFWKKVASQVDKNGNISPDWTQVADDIYRVSEDKPLWDAKREFRQGAALDNGEVVFHTGNRVYLVDRGEDFQPGDLQNREYCYTPHFGVSPPAFDNPFPQDSDEILRFLEIIKKLDWHQSTSAIATMTLLGYIATAPICGILPWRPHVWMDGPWGTGKTWLVSKVVMPALGEYCIGAMANTSEPGLRSSLRYRAIPIIFDESENAKNSDKNRMEAVVEMARHASSMTNMQIFHATPGGNGVVSYAVQTMMFMSSITMRLYTPADRSRFARMTLKVRNSPDDFESSIEKPLEEIVTPDFSRRLAARMVMHSKDMLETMAIMRRGMTHILGLKDRVAKIYSVFAAGAWTALRDGTPADEEAAIDFITDVFGAIEQIIDADEMMTSTRDHRVIFEHIMSHQTRVKSAMGITFESVGNLMRIATDNYDEDTEIMPVDAIKSLADLGIRPGFESRPAKHGKPMDCFLVMRDSVEIRKILEKTPYDVNYADVMMQDSRISISKVTTAFSGSLRQKPLVIPFEVFEFGDEQQEAGS